ncbi:uncharacterized protein [Rutidosis leptorrhynchoides]|uniref:uncharacterized protein n=1 Tax=Rutidosis leptorrhynchoides TaxID=125765 RepID=UPI003A9A5873
MKKKSFWEYNAPADSSWTWKKIMRFRHKIRRFIVHSIGNGGKTMAWYDNWHPVGPLDVIISRRDIYTAGYSAQTTVVDIVQNGEWEVPDAWKDKYGMIFDVCPPLLIRDRNDVVLWKSKDNKLGHFKVKTAFSDLSADIDEVGWAKLVWFSQCIHRHSFVLWVAMSNKLRTQDKYMRVEMNNSLKCPFCLECKDSHNHLFLV